MNVAYGHWTTRAVMRVAGLAALLVAVCCQAQTAEEGAVSSPPPGGELSGEDVLRELGISEEPSLTERERAVNEMLREAYEKAGESGVAAQFGGRPLSEIDPRGLALAALQRNLSIYRAHIRKDVAESALLEAQALFDPNLSFNFNYSNFEQFDRFVDTVRFRRGTVLSVDPNFPGVTGTNFFTGEDVFPHNLLFFDSGLVRYIGFNQPRPEGYRDFTETASRRPITGEDESYTFDFDVRQLLPWGVTLALNYETRYHERYFVNNAGSLPNESYGSFDRPWTSAIGATIELPVPGSKNYGPEASPADVQNRLAALADERAVWEVRSVINSTLLEVDIAYWELVGRASDLYAAEQNLKSVEALIAKTERMYELREITEYSRSQVQAEVARVRGVVEQARSRYVLASNALHPLLDSRSDSLYLPVGYSVPLAQPLLADPAGAAQADVSGNPDLQARQYDLQSAEVLRRQAEVQLNPDLTGLLAVTASQSDSVFGYTDYLGSTGHLFSPDRLSQAYSVQLVRPWGNRAAIAAHEGSEHGVELQTYGVRSTRNAVQRALSDAAVGVAAAVARVDITERNLQLAETRYRKAEEQQRSRGVTEFEIILQSNALLDAARDLIAALVQLKQAEARYLAALGQLPTVYAQRTAQTLLDRARVAALAEHEQLPYFAGARSEDHEP